MTYEDFIQRKTQVGADHGFDPIWMPDSLFDFQRALTEWALRKGRAAIFADCGLGKTPMQLVWAENVVQKTNGRVLILTPLAVGAQTIREGEKFGVDCYQSRDGAWPADKRIIVTNYEKLHLFNMADFSGCVCDESSILKNFDGATRNGVTEFMRKLPYRLLCTATAAPNDFIELGTSSEALGHMGFQDMLGRFFKRDEKFCRVDNRGGQGWRFRGYAERDFWRWVCSWARACRKPSDLGFDDGAFALPPLHTREHVVQASTRKAGWLFDVPASGLQEQRDERKRSKKDRCEMAASLINETGKPAVCWGYLNAECDMLKRMIPDAVQVSGKDTDEAKEAAFEGFSAGDIRVLITKPTIGAWGLNWQHCAHMTMFPSHSFEQYYQSVRRCWRFGQHNAVTVDLVTSEGERGVLQNIERKAEQADRMFEHLTSLMNYELVVEKQPATDKMEKPSWL